MDIGSSSIVPVLAPDGRPLFRIEARSLGGRQAVAALDGVSEQDLQSQLEAIGRTIGEVLRRVSPTKATAEFEVELALESGKLTSLLVKGSGKANLKISLEWDATKTGA